MNIFHSTLTSNEHLHVCNRPAINEHLYSKLAINEHLCRTLATNEQFAAYAYLFSFRSSYSHIIIFIALCLPLIIDMAGARSIIIINVWVT